MSHPNITPKEIERLRVIGTRMTDRAADLVRVCCIGAFNTSLSDLSEGKFDDAEFNLVLAEFIEAIPKQFYECLMIASVEVLTHDEVVSLSNYIRTRIEKK